MRRQPVSGGMTKAAASAGHEALDMRRLYTVYTSGHEALDVRRHKTHSGPDYTAADIRRYKASI